MMTVPDPTCLMAMDRVPDESWCVWTKHGRRPRYWHASRTAAEAEAKRLANLYPGQSFIVLQKVSKFRIEPPQAESAA